MFSYFNSDYYIRGTEMEKRKRGKPIKHPKILDLTTQTIYNTYTEAANAVGGSRFGVMRCCEGVQRDHKGHIFVYYVETKRK